ncbi:MAG: hypothetical protein LBS69_04265 [Prevotellaceae bacterium]|jgi:hypothetical protein|nr:hypothetical protein [Prevotellaceae bacterium]
MDNLFAILIILVALGIFILIVCLVNLGGNFVFKTLLNQLEHNLDYFYKELLLKFAIKGGFFGMITGPLIFALKLVEELLFEIIVNQCSNIICDYKEIYDFIIMIYDKLELNIILFCILLIVVALIVLIFFIIIMYSSIFFFGAVMGAIYGYVINVICGLIMSLFIKVDNMDFSIYKFAFDLQTIISTIIFGFGSGLFISNGNLNFGIMGSFVALCYKYFDKIKNQIVFSATKKVIKNIIPYYKIIIICGAIVFISGTSFNPFPKFNAINFVNKLFTYMPFVLIILYHTKLKTNDILHKLFIFSRDTVLDYIYNEIHPKITKLPDNLLLHIFACTLTTTIVYIFTLNTEYGEFILFVIPVTILIIEKLKKGWLFMVFGIILDMVTEASTVSFFIQLIIWAIVGHMIMYLLQKGDNALTKRRIILILKWLNDEKELYK